MLHKLDINIGASQNKYKVYRINMSSYSNTRCFSCLFDITGLDTSAPHCLWMRSCPRINSSVINIHASADYVLLVKVTGKLPHLYLSYNGVARHIRLHCCRMMSVVLRAGLCHGGAQLTDPPHFPVASFASNLDFSQV